MKISTLFGVAMIFNLGLGAYIQNSGVSKSAKPKSPIKKASNDDIEEIDSDKDEDVKNGTKIPIQCSQSAYQIKSAVELEQLQDCDDINGSVFINNYLGSIIDTGNIQTISGDFIISNASNLVRVNTPKLAVIGGTFGLNELTSLTAVHAPFLNSVSVVDWKVLPILSTVNFEHGIKKVKSITISDTSLVAFAGFDSDVLDTLNINNNRFLDNIDTGIKGINEKLSISANSKRISVSFPNLEYANNITIRDVSSLDLSKISKINASLELINNDFHSVKFPELSNVGGTLSLIENYNLKDVEFPSIDEIGGGLMIVNNTNLGKINFFPKLNAIGGAIEFIGDFKETNFSKLRTVKGSALVKTLYDAFDCDKWTEGHDENSSNSYSIIRGGRVICQNGSKQKTVQINEDGEIANEVVAIIEDIQGKDVSAHSNSAVSKSLTNCLLTTAIVSLCFMLFY